MVGFGGMGPGPPRPPGPGGVEPPDEPESEPPATDDYFKQRVFPPSPWGFGPKPPSLARDVPIDPVPDRMPPARVPEPVPDPLPAFDATLAAEAARMKALLAGASEPQPGVVPPDLAGRAVDYLTFTLPPELLANPDRMLCNALRDLAAGAEAYDQAVDNNFVPNTFASGRSWFNPAADAVAALDRLQDILRLYVPGDHQEPLKTLPLDATTRTALGIRPELPKAFALTPEREFRGTLTTPIFEIASLIMLTLLNPTAGALKAVTLCTRNTYPWIATGADAASYILNPVGLLLRVALEDSAPPKSRRDPVQERNRRAVVTFAKDAILTFG